LISSGGSCQIGVHDDHRPAPRVVQAGGGRHLVAEVARQGDDADGRVSARKVGEDGTRAVGAAVVHEDHLVALAQGVEVLLQLGVGLAKDFLLVQERDDDAEGRYGAAHVGVVGRRRSSVPGVTPLTRLEHRLR